MVVSRILLPLSLLLPSTEPTTGEPWWLGGNMLVYHVEGRGSESCGCKFPGNLLLFVNTHRGVPGWRHNMFSPDARMKWPKSVFFDFLGILGKVGHPADDSTPPPPPHSKIRGDTTGQRGYTSVQIFTRTGCTHVHHAPQLPKAHDNELRSWNCTSVPIFSSLAQSFTNSKERGARATHVHLASQLPKPHDNELRSLNCTSVPIFASLAQSFTNSKERGAGATHPNSQKHTITSCAR